MPFRFPAVARTCAHLYLGAPSRLPAWAWLGLLGLAGPAAAQLKPQYSQYMLNNYVLNPAITGIEDYTDLKLSYRQQWAGVDGAPTTFYASVHGKLGQAVNVPVPQPANGKAHAFWGGAANRYRKVKPHHALGGLVLHDRAGIFGFTEAQVSYAYHLLLSREVKLSLGAAAGLLQYSLRGADLQLANPNDPVAANQASLRPNLSLGLWLYGRQFYLGASAAHLLGAAATGAGPVGVPLARHFFVTGAWRVPLSGDLDLVPSVLAKWAAPQPPAVDLNARLVYANRLWVGAAYRQRDSVIFLAGLSVSALLDLSYTYDLGTHRLGRASLGSHEILLSLRLGNRYRVYCPQSLW
jgi:type IX secretion system PorP/SprF family membrane protein